MKPIGRSRQRLLLLNPPAPIPVFRDCYCSGPIKGGLAAHPLDLQLQSGFFDDTDFQVEFVDAIQEALGVPEALQRIVAFEPETVLTLVGDTVLEHDAGFLAQVRAALPRALVCASGDIARFTPRLAFERIPALDAILLDFTSSALRAHLRGEGTPGLLLRGAPNAAGDPGPDPYRHPLPRPEVAGKHRRQLPFFRVPEYYSLLTSYGCPYACRYCNAHGVGYRTRELDDVIQELRHAAGLGYRSLYIRDATFFFGRERTRALLDQWMRSGLRFEWICFSRPDLIDDEIAEAAAALGCRVIMLGVETFDDACLADLSRPLSFEAARHAFRILRRHRILRAAQLIAGLRRLEADGVLADLRQYESQLTDAVSALDPDLLSVGVYHPRPGVSRDAPTLAALAREREACDRLARRITRRFYCRPRTVVRQLASVRSVAQFALQARIAVRLLAPSAPPPPRKPR